MSKLSTVLNRLMTIISYESRVTSIPKEVIRTELARKLIFYGEPPYLWPGGIEDPRTKTKVKNPKEKAIQNFTDKELIDELAGRYIKDE